MTVETRHGTSLQWNAHKPDGPWFLVSLNPENLEILDCNDQPKAEKLSQILKAVKQLIFSISLKMNSRSFLSNR